MRVSIIVPTFNKLPRLKLMIESACNQKGINGEFEICVVDDGSTDGTKEYMLSYIVNHSNIKYIWQKNQGRSKARNEGIKNTTGQFIVFVDDDVLLPPDFLQYHLKDNHMNVIRHGQIRDLIGLKFFVNPTTGVYYPELNRNKESKFVDNCISLEDVCEHFNEKVKYMKQKICKGESLIEQVFLEKLQSYSWLAFTGGNVSLPRSFLSSDSMFDEKFGTNWGYEDFELGYRLWEKGYDFEYDYSAVAYHMSHYRSNAKQEADISEKYFAEKVMIYGVKYIVDYYNGKLSRSDLLAKLAYYNSML